MVSPTSKTPALEIRGLQAWYGESHVLHGVDIVVQPGEVVTLLGRNGAGKSTLLKMLNKNLCGRYKKHKQVIN